MSPTDKDKILTGLLGVAGAVLIYIIVALLLYGAARLWIRIRKDRKR